MEVREARASYISLTEPPSDAVPFGYKHTEVGLIPADWTVEPLSRVAPLQRGFDLPFGARRDGPYPVVYSNGTAATHDKFMVSGPGVVTGRSGTLGAVHFVESDFWPHNTSLWVTRFNANYPKFVYYLYCSIGFSRFASGSGVPTLNRNDAHVFKVGLPVSGQEQEAIAEALGDVDALIESLEQLIAKKRQIKQGTMQALLTPSEGWIETSLLELVGGKKELFDDGDWIESEHITDAGVRLIQTGNIGVGEFVEKGLKRYIFEASFISLRCKEIVEGDLLICRLADPAGRACVLPDIGEAKVVTSVDVTIFRPSADVANRKFLAYLFSTDDWFRDVSDRSGGTTHKRISRGALGRIEIKIPRVEEQAAIAITLSDMDAELAALETRLAKTRQLKQGMMQELLTGRIRLV